MQLRPAALLPTCFPPLRCLDPLPPSVRDEAAAGKGSEPASLSLLTRVVSWECGSLGSRHSRPSKAEWGLRAPKLPQFPKQPRTYLSHVLSLGTRVLDEIYAII